MVELRDAKRVLPEETGGGEAFTYTESYGKKASLLDFKSFA
jgi:hypothetical protein